MLYGERLDDSDIDVFGGCDWVECITDCIEIASSLVTLCLILMLLYFQIGLYGFNTICLRKTKTYALLLSLAFNICLIIDLLRYPQVGFLGETILGILEFAFKYSAIIALSKFFISRSGEIMKSCEKLKIQRRLSIAVLIALFLLLVIIILKGIVYMQINHLDHSDDVYQDRAFNQCKTYSTVAVHTFWMISNYVLLCLGYKIKGTIDASIEELQQLQKGSFYSKKKADEGL